MCGLEACNFVTAAIVKPVVVAAEDGLALLVCPCDASKAPMTAVAGRFLIVALRGFF